MSVAYALLEAVRDADRDLSDVFAGSRRLFRSGPVVVEARRGAVCEPSEEPEQVRARIERIGDPSRDQVAVEPARAARVSDQRAAAGGRLDVTQGRAPLVGPARLPDHLVRVVLVFREAG